MFCGKCGARINDSANFCAFRGEQAARFQVVDKTNLPQQISPESAAAQQVKGLKTATAALVLGIISIVLSLVFAPFIFSIFANLSMEFTTEDWILSILTIFLYLAFKLLITLFEGLASAIFFILPCVLLHTTGFIMAVVARVKYKEKKRSKPAIFVNLGAVLLQLIVLGICIGVNSKSL